MSDQTANLIIDLPSRAGQGASALPSVQTLAPSEVVEGLFYHTARSIEELDRAKASAGPRRARLTNSRRSFTTGRRPSCSAMAWPTSSHSGSIRLRAPDQRPVGTAANSDVGKSESLTVTLAPSGGSTATGSR